MENELTSHGESPDDELMRLELRIAQRADELSRHHGSSREKDVAHWAQAEQEMWPAPGL